MTPNENEPIAGMILAARSEAAQSEEEPQLTPEVIGIYLYKLEVQLGRREINRDQYDAEKAWAIQKLQLITSDS